jgi:hypothetical protein
MFEPRYRIVTDAYLGYEVQVKHWWWPCWTIIGYNTHPTLERAKAFAEGQKHKVVEYL